MSNDELLGDRFERALVYATRLHREQRRTVETHLSHIMQKLRPSTRAEFVRHALEHGLLEED